MPMDKEVLSLMDGLSDKVKGKKDLEKELYRAIVLQDKIEAKTEAFKTKEKDAKQRIAELQKQIEQETQDLKSLEADYSSEVTGLRERKSFRSEDEMRRLTKQINELDIMAGMAEFLS